MANQLWNNKRIADTVAMHELFEDGGVSCVSAATMYSRLTEMRDEYEALVPDAETRKAIVDAIEGAPPDVFEPVTLWLERLENT